MGKTIIQRKKTIKRKKTKKRKKNLKKIERMGGVILGKFYTLNEDSNGFAPLYLSLQNVNGSVLAWSCPPENYPKPIYTIRGMQQDILPPSILNNEIHIDTIKTRGSIITLSGKTKVKIKLTNNWILENQELWETIVNNYDL